MSTITQNTSETSVTFSLTELAKLEEERLHRENLQRARAREREAREQHEAEARRRASEAARVAADAETRAQREREEAEEKTRLEARARAAVEVARIEAEAKARLEVDNAARAHELAVLRVRAERGRSRLQLALAAALGLALFGGAAATYGATRQVASLEQDAERLRQEQATRTQERERASETDLAALDKRYAALRARPLLRDAEEAHVAAEAARNAVDVKAIDRDRLRAFGDALDALQARLDRLERLTALDRRHADLTAWAADRRRNELTAPARSAAARAKATGAEEGSLRAYEGVLDQLRDALTRSTASPGSRPLPERTSPRCTDEHDPLCGLDGRPL